MMSAAEPPELLPIAARPSGSLVSFTPQFFSTRFQDVIWAKNAASDVRLAPYDVVYVPRSGPAEVYRFFNTYLLQYVPVSWGFSYVVNNNPGSSVVPIH